MEKYLMLGIILVLNMTYVSSNTQPRGEYRISKNGELLNTKVCQLYKMTHTYTYKLECQVKCTRLMGCSNVHHFSESHLCLLCMDENANATDEWQGLTPYNTPRPQGGELYEKLDIDQCEYGKGCYNGGTCIDGVFSYTCLCPLSFTGSACEEAFVPSSCTEFGNNTASGVYNIFVQDAQNKTISIPMYCDMDTDGGGWMVIQRRQDGSVLFNKTWEEYERGFGDLESDFWLGNIYLAMITASNTRYTLRFDLESFNNEKRYAEYTDFRISNGTDKYRLNIGSYSGTAGDGGHGLSYQNQSQFTTKDQDNDERSGSNCAVTYGEGGFWFKACFRTNMNGVYKHSAVNENDGIIWYAWLRWVNLKGAEMKLKPLQ